jgi:DNA-binding HxlR family transcriptional regulator
MVRGDPHEVHDMSSGRLFGCPVELALSLIGGKWKTVIIARLKQGPLRYSELRRTVPDLADKVLTQRLRELETDGFVKRIPASENGATRYALTDRGYSLSPALEALYAWGEQAAQETGVRFRSARNALSEQASS